MLDCGDRATDRVEREGEGAVEDAAARSWQFYAIIWKDRVFLTQAVDDPPRRELH